MTSPTNDKKTHLLETGHRIFAAHGFTNVGLTELLKKAGIPKGSFYYYFNSKEEYGAEVIRYYMQGYTKKIAQLFSDPNKSGKERLLSYWEIWSDSQCDNDYLGQCLVVKLCSEVTDFSEAMRHEFYVGTTKILSLITHVIKEGQKDGSIPQHLNATLTAQELYQQWLGASLLTKILRTDCPFKTALHCTMKLLTI